MEVRVDGVVLGLASHGGFGHDAAVAFDGEVEWVDVHQDSRGRLLYGGGMAARWPVDPCWHGVPSGTNISRLNPTIRRRPTPAATMSRRPRISLDSQHFSPNLTLAVGSTETRRFDAMTSGGEPM